MPTSAPGVHICEHLPRMARWMHKAAIVRSGDQGDQGRGPRGTKVTVYADRYRRQLYG
jgi:hypothetical protein